MGYVYNYYPDRQRIEIWNEPTAVKILSVERRLALETLLDIMAQKTGKDALDAIDPNNQQQSAHSLFYYDKAIGDRIEFYIESCADEKTKQNWKDRRKATEDLIEKAAE